MNEKGDADTQQKAAGQHPGLSLPKVRKPPYLPNTVDDTATIKRSNSSLSALFASTSSLPTSRSSSPSGQHPRSSVLDGIATQRRNASPRPNEAPNTFEGVRGILARAFAPHVAVHASSDTDDLIRTKGLGGGLLELFRPFGEQIPGKVTTRDNIGASRNWQDFAIHFTTFPFGNHTHGQSRDGEAITQSLAESSHLGLEKDLLADNATSRNLEEVELLVERHLEHKEQQQAGDHAAGDFSNSEAGLGGFMSPFYNLYLRRIVSQIPVSAHETFTHPVACVIAIRSSTSSPIETLRRLYDEINQKYQKLAPWISNDYLRYYVLVHDEEKDDIAKSTSLFELMKRHFGLHCHLLRIRSTQTLPTDDDNSSLPFCEWQSAEEELNFIRKRETFGDVEDPSYLIFESDANAVRTFVREMVTQSIVPYMERCITTWNDQVASRRRGISGRLMTFSKKWAGFGGSSRSTSGGSGSSSDSSNYHALRGFYRPDSPEATMRRLADFAFMLRDWKLAQGVYELLKTDFLNDKAWKYHAGTHEMSALTQLVSSPGPPSKSQTEAIESSLETACYSYFTRCGSRYGTARCLAFAAELFHSFGGVSSDRAAHWATRIMELDLTGYIGNALFTERLADFFAAKQPNNQQLLKRRHRKASFWSILAANSWIELQLYVQASRCLYLATSVYEGLPTSSEQSPGFVEALAFIENLGRVIQNARAGQLSGGNEGDQILFVDEEHEELDSRTRRYSKIEQDSQVPVVFDSQG